MGATYRRTVRVTTAVEYAISRGSNIRDFWDIYNAAKAEYCRVHGPQAADHDHWCQVDSDGEHVIIRFETAKPLDATAGREGEGR